MPETLFYYFLGSGIVIGLILRWDGTEYWINFSGDHANKLVCELLLSPLRPVIRIEHNEALLQLFSSLTRTMRINPFFNPLITCYPGYTGSSSFSTSTQRHRSEYSDRIEAALSYISERAE